MCGIVGYIGKNKATPILLDGLATLEYRGYDSAGIALKDNNNLDIYKVQGRLQLLKDKLANGNYEARVGIGHTRWATHGKPTEANAHPHHSDDYGVVGVHNGIIENYHDLKNFLIEKGYAFYSQTDTEVAIKLVAYFYALEKEPLKAIREALKQIRGSYALALLFKDYDELYLARKESPLLIGLGEGENFIASDATALLKYTKHFIYLDNLELGCLKEDSVKIYDLELNELNKKIEEVNWDASRVEMNGYEHYMLKEIEEQPQTLKDTCAAIWDDEGISLKAYGLTEERLKSFKNIYIVACGSAYHVGMLGSYVIEKLAKIPVRVELASEFRYREPLIKENDLVVIISQSGETADSLAALRLAKERGAYTLGIVNVEGSSIAREADSCFITKAGPEIAVATTKAYSAQLMAIYGLALAYCENALDYREELEALAGKVEVIINQKEKMNELAELYVNEESCFFIGRGCDYALALEGSLKLKEISYIHSEAYAAGELKHGTISLIEEGIIVFGLLTQPDLYEKTISNMAETKARGAYLIGLGSDEELASHVDKFIKIPQCNPLFAISLGVVYLQLLSYYVALKKGYNVDKPRNLAKSVTVE